DIWLQAQLKTAQYIAGEPQVREWVTSLTAPTESPGDERHTLQDTEPLARLRTHLADARDRTGFQGWYIISRDLVIVAAPIDPLVGRSVRGPQLANLNRLFETGEPQLVIPMHGLGPPRRMPDASADSSWRRRASRPDRPRFQAPPFGPTPEGAPPPGPESRPEGGGPGSWRRPDNPGSPQVTVMLSSPVRDPDGKVVAALGLHIQPEGDFTRVLSSARFGATGETYAFNKEGYVISQSRFEDQLRALGLLTNNPAHSSVLALALRDPGGDLTRGYQPLLAPDQRPFTRIADRALAGESGLDVTGFRDYRGVTVVGAWRWLPQYEIGVATQVDFHEAYQPLLALERVFLLLVGALGVSSAGLLGYSFVAGRLQHRVREAELKARRLGQYRLEHKVGEGGMGVVYRAQHALLRRPTAIKLLLPSKASPAAIALFEQEVQLTSRLTHPNTIQIYDYGHSDDGIFYYAMEFLEGLNLKDFVHREGPIPPGRIIAILTQICGSLGEAHRAGLVHRDIKPANVFLTHRGGCPDWVKVLDFGLVTPLTQATAQPTDQTSRRWLAGTPGYMAPEAFQTPTQVDPRSDIYSLGAVGWFLLTGRELFAGLALEEIIQQHARLDPPPFSPANRAANGSLANLLIECLKPDPADRPQTVAMLLERLHHCPERTSWEPQDAARWWESFLREQPSITDPTAATPSPPLARTLEVDLQARGFPKPPNAVGDDDETRA
ncbi:MAG: serine/threonine protein kinase, partial [Verrucomicrobia bacterium]|nr:serine/threonine protein kinase [Verrucomicrobiota bacterium]